MRSIRSQVSAAFLLFLLLTVILAVFSIGELAAVNRTSQEVRGRWLQSVRLLGDLNNYTSDYRAAEADRILAAGPTQVARAEQNLKDLDLHVAIARNGYAQLPHDSRERSLYSRFDSDWAAYHGLAAEVTALARQGAMANARDTYVGRSGPAYDAASNALGALTELTVSRAQAASGRAAERYRSARWVLVAAIAAAFLAVVASLELVTRSVSNPLLALAARMRALAANNTTMDIPGEGRADEIGEMARAVRVFRTNAIELARAQEGLRRQAKLLQRSLDQERRLSNLQRDFVSMASHEFRTPLTVIDAQAQNLARHEGRLASGEATERAASVRRSVRRITEVIDSLLQSTDIDGAAALQARLAVFDPAVVIAESMTLQRESAPAGQIEEDLERAPRRIVADRVLLAQAVSNLLSNAVKYSPPESPVRLRAWGEAGRLFISVADEGRGIPEADVDRVFDRYRRGANVGGVAGAGVGLFLVRTVAELHGGSVSVRSREGEGACFTLEIPLEPSNGASPAAERR
ncbi:MAG: MCP four helix bundle domain-containing protein [Caulobacteraceae bacterium]|nr:MCP four helix bundle domain-containing protein [Caulobacteraceae bacterium]